MSREEEVVRGVFGMRHGCVAVVATLLLCGAALGADVPVGNKGAKVNGVHRISFVAYVLLIQNNCVLPTNLKPAP